MAGKAVHEMRFAEFAAAAVPMAAANRMPQVGKAAEVLTYHVYFNGPAARGLPAGANEYLYNDVTLHKLTEALGLDSSNFRDNQRVAEVVALRSAWMAAVLAAAADRTVRLSPVVEGDYEALAAAKHAWVAEQVREQLARDRELLSVMRDAGATEGGAVRDGGVPEAVNRGSIVARSDGFTVQQVQPGVVVAHENDRLSVQAAVGDQVTITYYRGQGQVVGNVRASEIVGPFLDEETQDLAVRIIGSNGDHLVLFHGVAPFRQFVESEGLAEALVASAVDVMATRAERGVAPPPVREAVSGVFIDETSGALAANYREGGVAYTVLFGSAKDVRARGEEFGLPASAVEQAEGLYRTALNHGEDFAKNVQASHAMARQAAAERFAAVHLARGNGGRYAGPIVAETAFHVVQDIGRGEAVVHNKLHLTRVPEINAKATIVYERGQGRVAERTRAAGHER